MNSYALKLLMNRIVAKFDNSGRNLTKWKYLSFVDIVVVVTVSSNRILSCSLNFSNSRY